MHEGFVNGLISSWLGWYPRCGFGFRMSNLSHWVLEMAAAQVGHLRSSDRCDHRKGPHGGHQRGAARCYPTVVGCPVMKRDAWKSPINPGNGKIIYWWIVFYCHVWLRVLMIEIPVIRIKDFPWDSGFISGTPKGRGRSLVSNVHFLKPTFTLGSRVPPMYIEIIELWPHIPNVADASKWLMHWPFPFSKKK